MMSMFYNFESLKQVVDFASNLISNFNVGEYVKNVNDLHGNESSRACVDAQIDLIKSDPKLSTEEKINLMSDAEAQHNARDIEHKAQRAQIIDRGRDRKILSLFLVVDGIVLTGCAACAFASGIQNHTGIQIVPRTNS